MALTRETMLARMLASDPAYDGRFITGVVSTGIYCLPSCKARKPRPENVVFHATPDEARAAGLRPCLRCRPDDFYLGYHADEVLVEGLASALTLDPGSYRDLGALAAMAGVSLSKLHDLFRKHYHTTPADFLARSRIRAAKRALLTTERPITEIAFEVGFESLSTFGSNFRKYSAMTPQAFRRWRTGPVFELALPGDYPREVILRALARDPPGPTARVEGHVYTTALRLGEARVVVQVSLNGRTARCAVSAGAGLEVGQRLELHGRLLGLLGLHADPLRFEAQVGREADLRPLIEDRRGLRFPLLTDPFDALVWAILGQQVSFARACTLRFRLVERWGQPVAGGLYALPSPEALARLGAADLLPLGLTRARAETLIGAALAVADGRLPLAALEAQSVTRIERLLLAVRGIGPWTAHYVLMHGYGFPDCVPLGDSGLGESLKRFFALGTRPTHPEMARLMRRFAPYRSLATLRLWHHLTQPSPAGSQENL
ncbi:DNA-3-methyladenine glycosylase 2 family protein [Deinococcus aetherius]|nr:Ada metal-binding domain-containing protein [Deinococcus aetherius]